MTQSVYLVGNGWTESGHHLEQRAGTARQLDRLGHRGNRERLRRVHADDADHARAATYSFALKSSGTTSVYFNTKEAASNHSRSW